MSDLISRQDVIQTFIDWGLKEFGYHDLMRNERFIDAIKVLPSAESKCGKWILCSKDLPTAYGEYMVTVLTNPSNNPITTTSYYDAMIKEFGTHRYDGTWERWNVVAWKAKPEPYNGEKS